MNFSKQNLSRSESQSNSLKFPMSQFDWLLRLVAVKLLYFSKWPEAIIFCRCCPCLRASSCRDKCRKKETNYGFPSRRLSRALLIFWVTNIWYKLRTQRNKRGCDRSTCPTGQLHVIKQVQVFQRMQKRVSIANFMMRGKNF